MTPCEICGRPVEGVGMFSEAHVDPSHFDDCYKLGWEREKSRAEALDKIASASLELMATHDACDRAAEANPGVMPFEAVVRYMQAKAALRKALEGYVP